jgi:hypothetical protein
VSISLVENEVQRFLSSEEPEVICISGHWGAGKTFTWKKFLKAAKGKIALKRYSYVSLFGVNSLDEFKYSIFENSVQSSDVDVEPSLKTVQSNATAVANYFGRKSLRFLQQIPLIKNYVGGLGPVWFLSVSETIVCVDDIERKGAGLSVRDVLGLVSQLKEQKRCKVCLILNDEAFVEKEELQDFQKYFEKTVDTTLRFAPSAAECARIAIDTSTTVGKMLAENCVVLDISNIRLIKRIERAALRIEPILVEFDEQVLAKTVRSLTLLGWSLYEPLRAPPADYLKRRAADLFSPKKRDPVSDREAAWNALLDAYGFFAMDEFDLALLDGLRDGLFDPSVTREHAAELDKAVQSGKSESSWTDAWRVYHESFADNQQQVLDTIHQAFIKDIQHRTPPDLNATVWLLKELGRPAQAAEILSQYVEIRGDNRGLFDLDNYPFLDRIDDPDVIQAFKDKFATFSDERDPAAVLLSVANKHGWSVEEISSLSTVSVDEYYTIFKSHEGELLRKMIEACLQFGRIEDAGSTNEISKRAKDALKRIGEESHINALRVKKYGVDVGVDRNDRAS